MRIFWRGFLALTVLAVGGWYTYAFGAGYFGKVSFPTPWNIVAVAIMTLGLLAFVALILFASVRDPRNSHR